MHELENQEEAVEVFNEVINRFKDSSNPKILKLYSEAQLKKVYCTNDETDNEEALGIYNEIIEKFQETNNRELLKELATTQFRKAMLLQNSSNNNEAAIKVYSDIIQKLQEENHPEFSNELCQAMSTKSYLLSIGVNTEEAMHVYNDIIEKFKNSDNQILNTDVSWAIINNIELSLINNMDDFDYRDLADQYVTDQEDTQPILDMLSILRDAQNSNQESAVNDWKNQYDNYQFSNWSFAQLENWSNTISDPTVQNRINNYLNEFEQHNPKQSYGGVQGKLITSNL